jgi:SWI/SNF-related matrix-associated actin-dependent regulator of chromatin subfamily A member 5
MKSFQNESSVPSSNKETDIDTNRSKRFDFLLKQTEIFSHFMPGSSKITPEKKKKPGRKKEAEAEVEPEPEPELDPDGDLDPNADPAE